MKKDIKILGISIWRILAYFIIYSIAGYAIETIFGAITKGMIESRKSFLYGPFCAIYGLGATILIVSLKKVEEKPNAIFIGGFIIGSITEYIVSLFGEMLLNVKWWDYSNMPLNIQGRICVYYSIFWGFLSLYLMLSFNPKIDRLINWIKTKISVKWGKIAIVAITIFMFIDCIITGIALKFFYIRMIVEKDINIKNKSIIEEKYEEIYSNENKKQLIDKFWGNKKIITTFPNLRVQAEDGEMIYFDSLLPEIQAYYYKFTNFKSELEDIN